MHNMLNFLDYYHVEILRYRIKILSKTYKYIWKWWTALNKYNIKLLINLYVHSIA